VCTRTRTCSACSIVPTAKRAGRRYGTAYGIASTRVTLMAGTLRVDPDEDNAGFGLD